MAEFDPFRAYRLLADLVGNKRARLLGQIVIYISWAAFVIWALSFIYRIVKPGFTAIIEGLAPGITIDNIETIITALLITVVIFSLIIASGQYLFMRALRKRAAPQWVIDEVAEYRSKGISILNDRPISEESGLVKWHESWTNWGRKVSEYLGDHFTRAERLSFERLGVVPQLQWGSIPIDGEHAHYLNQLAKQLTILENLIQRHLERK